MGGELKSTFCLVKDGEAILSQHQGDLEDAATFDDYRKNLDALRRAVRSCARSRSSRTGIPNICRRNWRASGRAADALPLIEVQHHHAHIAACLAENGYALDAPAVLGIVLDGLGWGDDDTLWGGEFLLADYRGYRASRHVQAGRDAGRRAGRARTVAQSLRPSDGRDGLGGIRDEFRRTGTLHGYLSRKPRATLDAMLTQRHQCAESRRPAAGCSTRWRRHSIFAASGRPMKARRRARLEAMVDEDACATKTTRSAIPSHPQSARLRSALCRAAWRCGRRVLGDLILKTPAPVMAARFHKGLAKSIVAMTRKLASGEDEAGPRALRSVALSGGCFQNRVLFEQVVRRLESDGFTVLSHAQVPANDGGLALGQAAIGAAHLINAHNNQTTSQIERKETRHVSRNSRADRKDRRR